MSNISKSQRELIITKEAQENLKKRMDALEADIREWLQHNRPLSYEKKLNEIIETFENAELTTQFLLSFAAHLFTRLDDATFVIDRERQFEPFISRGYKHLRHSRLKASKKRKKGKPKLLKKIRSIMRPYKNEGHSFKEFLICVQNGAFDSLTIKINSDKQTYAVLHENSKTILENVKERTIENWYTDCNK